MQTISSQRHLDDNTVAAKQANQDYTVSVSPVFVFEGNEYRIVLDGHHSLAAAQLDGVSPEYVELDASDDDRICLLNRGEIDDFFAVTYMDSDWYDVDTQVDLW